MSTFSVQDTLPSLPVPDLNETLDRYLISASVGLSEEQLKSTADAVEEFRISPLVRDLQEKLIRRGNENRNWLDEWWVEAYMRIRSPLLPYLSFGSKNPNFTKKEGSQAHRAADIIHHWMNFWQMIRQEKIPVFKSRGVSWDMSQYHYVFNSNRTPDLPHDRMDRYFKTESEGLGPTHMLVLCRGNIWKVNVVNADNTSKSADELYYVIEYILENSTEVKHSTISMTSTDRDSWAQVRNNIVAMSAENTASMQLIEQSLFCLTLSDEIIDEWKQVTLASCLGSSRNQWADKSVNMTIFKDGQSSVLAEHSNMDAIVIIHADGYASSKVRQELWTPKEVAFEKPSLIELDLLPEHLEAIDKADKAFEERRRIVNYDVVDYKGFGNALLKKHMLYADTVLQIVLQLAYAKVHKSFAPIYETASTRQFYHGRTETVRGRTSEMVEFGRAVMENKPLCEQARLFKLAYDSHNKLMADAMKGQGVDRHLFGLRRLLGEINSKRALPIPEPRLYSDSAWKLSGGDGNFLLSTSFVGYMSDEPKSMYGKFCSPMCPDGYGTYYQIAHNRLMFNITDFKNTNSNLKEYGAAISWALDHIHTLLTNDHSKL